MLGIGGSALGLIALNSALRSPYPWAEGRPNLHVLDNIDPEHTIGGLFQAEARATEAALVRAGRPVASVTFPELGPGEVGEFFYWLEVLVVAAGALLGINPLDQPGVEEGKQYAYALLGRPGYEAKLRELQAVESRKA